MFTLAKRMKALKIPVMRELIEIIEKYRNEHRTGGIYKINKDFTLDELIVHHFNNSHWDESHLNGWSCKLMNNVPVMANNVFDLTNPAISYISYIKTLLLKLDIGEIISITNISGDFNLADYITKIDANLYHQDLFINYNIKEQEENPMWLPPNTFTDVARIIGVRTNSITYKEAYNKAISVICGKAN